MDFIKRGLLAASGGPIVLAIIYGIIGATEEGINFSPHEVCTGILTITLMAFIAAGITTVYQIEHLPLPSAILIHCGVLYLDYLIMYLLNNWIPRDWHAIGFFSVIFLVSFALVWFVIYLTIRNKTKKINQSITNRTN